MALAVAPPKKYTSLRSRLLGARGRSPEMLGSALHNNVFFRPMCRADHVGAGNLLRRCTPRFLALTHPGTLGSALVSASRIHVLCKPIVPQVCSQKEGTNTAKKERRNMSEIEYYCKNTENTHLSFSFRDGVHIAISGPKEVSLKTQVVRACHKGKIGIDF